MLRFRPSSGDTPAARPHKRGQQADGRQTEGGHEKRGRIVRLELKEQAAGGSARRERDTCSNDQTKCKHAARLPEHQPQYIAPFAPSATRIAISFVRRATA